MGELGLLGKRLVRQTLPIQVRKPVLEPFTISHLPSVPTVAILVAVHL